jgi:hypothetical protein
MSNPEDILEKVLTGELTREEAVKQRPDMEDRLLLLSGLAGELRELPRQAPDPDFRNHARLRLLQRIQETQQHRKWWHRVLDSAFAMPGWASRVSAVLIATGGLTFGASYASASALPDDALYRVKRAVEQVQVTFATSDEAKANTYLDLADRRAAEIAATAGDLDEEQLQGLTQDYGNALQRVSLAVQTLSAPPAPLLDRVQAHVASQATEIEARALNSNSRPRVQQRLVQAEVVASNVVDHVTLVAEKSGNPGPQDVHLANNPPAAATAAAAVLARSSAQANGAAATAGQASGSSGSAAQANGSSGATGQTSASSGTAGQANGSSGSAAHANGSASATGQTNGSTGATGQTNGSTGATGQTNGSTGATGQTNGSAATTGQTNGANGTATTVTIATAAPSAGASAAPAASPSAVIGGSALDGQFDRLWNQVAAAPFLAQKVRTQLEVDVANAKQDVRAGQKDTAAASINAFVVQLQTAVKANQATQYTASHLIADAKAILTEL